MDPNLFTGLTVLFILEKESLLQLLHSLLRFNQTFKCMINKIDEFSTVFIEKLEEEGTAADRSRLVHLNNC